MNCPNCGQPAPPTSTTRCGHCNFKLPAMPVTEAAQPEAVLSCWNCHHPNQPDTGRCERCNAKLEAGTGPRTVRISEKQIGIHQGQPRMFSFTGAKS